MPGRNDWELEARDSILGEGWTTSGPNRIVKVTGISRPPQQWQSGYVTLDRHLVGRTPYQMQRALGLQLGDLKGGCLIYRFTRLPRNGEYANELTTEFPDGLAFDENAFEEERLRRRMKPSDEKKWGLDPDRRKSGLYRIGDSSIPQWNLLVPLPVEDPPFRLLTGTPYPSRP